MSQSVDLRLAIERGLGVPFSLANKYRVIIALGDREVRVHVYYGIAPGSYVEGRCGFPCTPETADALSVQLCNVINETIGALKETTQ